MSHCSYVNFLLPFIVRLHGYLQTLAESSTDMLLKQYEYK